MVHKKEMTRAQAASWIVRALDLKAEGTAPFSDIENYAADTKAEIVAAYENGLIKGINGKFMPSEKVTRAQFALMLERAYENYTGKNTQQLQKHLMQISVTMMRKQ